MTRGEHHDFKVSCYDTRMSFHDSNSMESIYDIAGGLNGYRTSLYVSRVTRQVNAPEI
jgi:hypothetical protein